MGCTAEDPMAGGKENEIEIKIKTLDSQTYTMRVNKQVPVPDLKQQIATVTGVLSDQQRLICRGKVLKDDQRLCAYHVEDGHTLHLVTRQPVPPSSEGSHNQSDAIPGLGMSHGQDNQVAPGFLPENLNVPNQGDAIPPEINQLVSAVLGAFGVNDIGGNQGPDARVVPDSLTTLSQYLSRLRREFGRGNGNNVQTADIHGTAERESNSISHSVTAPGLTPTASLAELMLSARQMLIEQVGESLLQLQRQLENQETATNLSERRDIQFSAGRTGVLLQNVGAFLLELGRTTMTLIMGQMPSEAMVNTGPALFISPSGPNPLMVQAQPFQPGTSFGSFSTGTAQPGSGLVNGFGFLPRRIDIQIRRGSSMVTPNVNQVEHGYTNQPSGQRNPVTSSGGENPATSLVSEGSSIAAVPMRSMLGAVSGPFSSVLSDPSSGLLGLYPVLGRLQHVGSGHAIDELGSQASGEHQATGFQTEQLNEGGRTTEGSLPTPSLRHLAPSESQNFRINLQSTDGTITNQEAEGHMPSSVLQFLRTMFAGGEIEHVEDFNSQGIATNPVTEHSEAAAGAMDAQQAEPEVTDEGIFLSNMLREMMRFISQDVDPNVAPPEGSSASEHGTDSSSQAESSVAGTLRRESDNQASPPNSKRQKMDDSS
ncbi:ubiquitin-like domain-containing protein CIP73 isoform X1 [Vitis riparia]|uniref:ubiquitin-like domain-containing protein CIP73 isoform X1 n=1 Tax=Vitis riparia TaxID=96939 RepID=UPI00155AD360|nr:ubiquitin-like domain-containing protein CIP73 isoform X1 [Vitis riparia]XP_034699660.1 ubiquitin-like domain-containing protein CIP73 isoform X1 [Vitis riparia]